MGIYPSFYAINQIKKDDYKVLYFFLSFYDRYELSRVNDYYNKVFKGSLTSVISNWYNKKSFPLRLKTRMSYSTGAGQSRLI